MCVFLYRPQTEDQNLPFTTSVGTFWLVLTTLKVNFRGGSKIEVRIWVRFLLRLADVSNKVHVRF